MSTVPKDAVVTYWSKLIESFHVSSSDFYASVVEGVDLRKIPYLFTHRVFLSEGGILEGEREYLTIEGERHFVDVCAAPFGTGFFFSTRLRERRARLVPLYWGLFALATFVIWRLMIALFVDGASPHIGLGELTMLRLVGPAVLLPLSGLIVLWLVALTSRAGRFEPEAAVLATPLVGALYRNVFAPETYFRIDTAVMFRTAVQQAVLEAIEEIGQSKGLRAHGEDERPVHPELVGTSV